MLARTAAGGLQFLESVHLPKATLKVSCDHDMSHDCHMTPHPRQSHGAADDQEVKVQGDPSEGAGRAETGRVQAGNGVPHS